MPAERGLSVEVQGSIWARKKAAEIRAGLEDSILIVRDTPEYQRILELSPLTGEEEIKGWGVRVDSVGNIYTPIWRSRDKDTKADEEGKKQLLSPEGYSYRVMNRKRLRRDFFQNLPSGLSINELLFLEVDSDIEKAIRQQRHILERYQPGEEAEEMELARKVVEYSERLANKYISPDRPVRSADLRVLGRETGQFLEEIDLVDPRDPEKQKMLQMLLKVNLKDSLGRVNPLVQRVRARAAYLAATKRLVVGGLITRKFASNEQVLLYERETTRWDLQTAFNQLESLLGHADFRNPDESATKLQRSAIANILMNISEGHLAIPRVKAYLVSSRYAAINLVGCREIKREENRLILGDSAEELFSRTPTRSLIMDGKFSEAKKRIMESMSVIKEVLDEHR